MTGEVVFKTSLAPNLKKKKKKLCKILKQKWTKYYCRMYLQVTDFLDVTFDLRTDNIILQKR